MNNLLKVMSFFLLLLVIVSNTLFVISEVERGVTLRFGEIVEADIKPGLHYKIPLVDDLKRGNMEGVYRQAKEEAEKEVLRRMLSTKVDLTMG